MDELRLAIVGDPVAHSLSPLLHTAVMHRLGLRGNYGALRVPPAELPATVARMRTGVMTGFNVTLPHKEAIVPLLDELEAEAEELRAVNTVEIRKGVLRGHNTDRIALRQLMSGEGLGGKEGLLVGAGGSAQAAAFALGDLGIGRLTVLNRDRARADRLVEKVRTRFPGIDLRAAGRADHEQADSPGVVINATSLGLRSTDDEPLPRAFWNRKPGLAVDLVYGDQARFLPAARERGWRAIDGLVILVRQGLLALQVWSGVPMPNGLEAEVLRDIRGRTR